MLTLYEQAAGTCPGLSWAVLAAIGTVESGNGTSNLPGVHSGANAAGAEGPMQFEPATFAAYDMPVPPGGASPPNPYDPTDAVYAAARYLCANGAGSGATLTAAVFAYNHSQAYVSAGPQPGRDLHPASGAHGVSGSGPDRGRRMGHRPDRHPLHLGWRIARRRLRLFGAGPGGLQGGRHRLAPGGPGPVRCRTAASTGVPPAPGDLVFFGGGTADVEHVGLVVAPGVMVDAPFTGADVREDPFPSTVGAPFGSQIFVGATRPGG